MKYAIIGTSWITEKFISAASSVGGFELYAVYSRSEEKAKAFAEKHNAKTIYTDIEEMAKDKNIESVYIASPNVFHYEQSKLMLMNGKNVFCEKPATTSARQMCELIETAEKNNLVYLEAIMTIHTEGFRKIKSKLPSLGNIRSAHFDFYQLSSKYPLYTEGKNPNIFNPVMHAGCLMDIGVYNIYLAAALFGEPDKIISDTVFLSNNCDAAGSAILKYGDLSVTLNYSKVGQTYSYSEIIGDTGTILISSVSQLTGVSFRHKETTQELIPEEVSRDIIMGAEASFFLNMCKDKDFTSEEYIFAKNTALITRRICDIIRADNSFMF